MKRFKNELLKKIAVVMITAILLTFGGITTFAVDIDAFTDVPTSHWAYQSIMNMVRLGVISGYPDNTFKPDKPVSREEFAKILCGATSTPLANPNTSTFADVPTNYWAFRYVETVKNYLTGYPAINGGKALYKGTQDATREDVAVALVKIKGFDKTVISNPKILDDMFKDVDTVSENLKNLVAIAVEKKLISGYTDQTIRASQTLTRAEAAVLIDRANRIAGAIKDDSFQNSSTLIYLSVECTNVGKVGEISQATASGVYTDGSVRDLTTQANWTSTDNSITGVSSAGSITFKKNGVARIVAQFDGKSDSEEIMVLPKYQYIPNDTGNTGADVDDVQVVALKIVPDVKQLNVGGTINYKAMAYYEDEDESKSVTKYTTWESSDNNVAIINSDGKAVGIKAGLTLIKATYDNKVAYAALTVTQDVYTPPTNNDKILTSIVFSHVTKFIKKGETSKIQILGTFSNKSKGDVTSTVKWSIENEKIAFINNDGTIVGLSEGMTKITASIDGKSCSMYIFVNNTNSH